MLHELRSLEESRVVYVTVVKPSPKIIDGLELLVIHPLMYCLIDLGNNPETSTVES